MAATTIAAEAIMTTEGDVMIDISEKNEVNFCTRVNSRIIHLTKGDMGKYQCYNSKTNELYMRESQMALCCKSSPVNALITTLDINDIEMKDGSKPRLCKKCSKIALRKGLKLSKIPVFTWGDQDE